MQKLKPHKIPGRTSILSGIFVFSRKRGAEEGETLKPFLRKFPFTNNSKIRKSSYKPL